MTEDEARDAANAVMCARTAHDIGNPPFGHFGEVVIGDWFKSHLDRLSYKGRPLSQWLDRQMKADLCHFEGNAQALRLADQGVPGGQRLRYGSHACRA